MLPLEKSVAVGLFQLLNQLHEQTSFIITTNKSQKEWTEMLGDEVLATALLGSAALQMRGHQTYRKKLPARTP
jgi:DNA replication protein DnaC